VLAALQVFEYRVPLRDFPEVAVILQPPERVFGMIRLAVRAEFGEQGAQFFFDLYVWLQSRLAAQHTGQGHEQ
jgi:hypothetical protein